MSQPNIASDTQQNGADIIVVGGGSAGCAVAGRLAAAGIRVLLVEAGDSRRAFRSSVPALMSGIVHNPAFDWCYLAEPDETVFGRKDVWPAGKRLGGGSAINGMMFVRGHPFDYDRWAELGATGWDYKSVLPYFRRIEDNERGADEWRGSGGPISVSECRSNYAVTERWLKAVEQAGYPLSKDLNGECAEGADHIQLSQRNGLRSSSAGYLEMGGKNLKVLPNTEVQQLALEDRRVTGVRIIQHGSVKTLLAGLGVVVSAGALNTPRLLMLSGIGPAASLQAAGREVLHSLLGVGANLQEHVGVHLVNEVRAHTLNDDAKGLSGARQLLKFLLARRGALTTGIGHAQAFLRTRKGLEAPNIQLAFSAFAFDLTPKGNLKLRPNSSVSTIAALTRPGSRGTISLNPNEPEGPPVIRHNLLGDEDDVEQLVEGLLLARKIMEQQALAGIVEAEVRPHIADEERDNLRGYVRAAGIPMFHPAGTARMGRKDDPLTVTGPNLLVTGMENLWIADASVMPTLPAGNTNATAIMIGDKASDLVLEQIKEN